MTNPADDVDDRVCYLSLTAVHVQLAEERRLGTDAQLLLPPRLVEERDRQHRRSVVDDGFDERTALTRPPAVDRAHLGKDGGLLAYRERGDVGLLRPVD